jgi:predicted nucleotide-binding protein with TIR-like domain
VDASDGEVRVRKLPPFPSRQQVIAAAKMLMALGHSGFEELRLEYDLLDTDAGTGSGLAARAMSLATFAAKHPDFQTADGISLQSAMVARAGEIYRGGTTTNLTKKERAAFKAASLSAGSMNDVSKVGEEVVPLGQTEPAWTPEHVGQPLSPPISKPPRSTEPVERPRKVFVVHGHDELMREQVARYLEQLDFEAIVLHEQTNRGKTLVEKLEANGDVGFAIILLSGDDHGSKPGDALRPRARQNVVLEWGYFWGRLGREHVIVPRKGDVDLPSDMSGLVWELFDDRGAWKSKISGELEAAGMKA